NRARWFLGLLGTATLGMQMKAPAHAAPPPAPELTKEQALAEATQLLRENSYSLAVQDGKISGTGAAALLAGGRASQFFIIAEEHNTQTLPRLAAALLAALEPAGYEYIATESATAHARWASEPPQRGNREAIFGFAHRYPYELTFYRDDEAQMFVDAGRISEGKGRAIWGVDQEFGAEPALEIIARAAPDPAARDYVESLLERARDAEHDRTKLSEHHFIVDTKPPEWRRLQQLYRSVKDADVQWLIQDLLESSTIYDLYTQHRGFMNSLAREDYMKRVFMDEYRRSAKLDGRLPKVIFKAGHWHALRGENPNHVFTTGEMLSELAATNGSRAFVLSTYHYEPDNYMTIDENLRPLVTVAKSDANVLVLFEPLRESLYRKRFVDNLPPGFVDLLFRADAALILGGEKRSGTERLDAAPHYDAGSGAPIAGGFGAAQVVPSVNSTYAGSITTRPAATGSPSFGWYMNVSPSPLPRSPSHATPDS
ncbi:MAG TPA: hypothetical protein VK669_06200, partial [Candidatus Limnocylindrales bacterium]|nr:hypothetical protein [Candidatus Limnocylindrales bacterium]